MGIYNTGTNGISKTRHFIFILSSIRKNMDVHWIILYTNFNVQQLYQWEISLCIYILWPSLHVCNYVILNKYWIVQRLVCEKNIPYKNIIAIKFSHIQIKGFNKKLKIQWGFHFGTPNLQETRIQQIALLTEGITCTVDCMLYFDINHILYLTVYLNLSR